MLNPLKEMQEQAKQTAYILCDRLKILHPRVTSKSPPTIPTERPSIPNMDRILFSAIEIPCNSPISVKISANRKNIVIYAPTNKMLSIVFVIVLAKMLSGRADCVKAMD